MTNLQTTVEYCGELLTVKHLVFFSSLVHHNMQAVFTEYNAFVAYHDMYNCDLILVMWNWICIVYHITFRI